MSKIELATTRRIGILDTTEKKKYKEELVAEDNQLDKETSKRPIVEIPL